MLRTPALAGIAKRGRFGANKGAPGVTLSVVGPIAIVSVIARKGRAKALKDALAELKKVEFLWAGPDQYYIYNGKYKALQEKLNTFASLTDQSHARVLIKAGGPKARALLAKGTPVDLRDREFPIGKSALTQMAHVAVHLTRIGPDDFTISIFRSFSEGFWEWMAIQAGEFGYQVS